MDHDIRLGVTALDHPKLMALQLRHGEAAIVCLLRLWCFTRVNHPKGTLTGMDERSIALASRWPLDRALEWVAALLDLRLLDAGDGGFEVHDWREHQPYSFFTEKRRAIGRNGAQVRWNKRVARYAGSNARSNAVTNAPTPTPDPDPDPDPDQELHPPTPLAQKARAGGRAKKLRAVQDNGFGTFKDWAYEQWLQSGEVGKWPQVQWVRLHAGMKLMPDLESARRSWLAYIHDGDPFYAGHSPSKWASQPGRWISRNAGGRASYLPRFRILTDEKGEPLFEQDGRTPKKERIE